MSEVDTDKILQILEEVKPLAIEYYELTQKPLGVTGEIAEYWAAKELSLQLAPARTPGYDATRIKEGGGVEYIQIKGRAYGKDAKPGQRISRIKCDQECHTVLLVLLDNNTLEPREMWEAPYKAVEEHLRQPGSKSRERGGL